MASKRRQIAAIADRRVRLFRNGHSQCVQISGEWELPGSEAMIRKDGDRLIVTSAPQRLLLTALRELGPLPETDRMPPIGDLPPGSIEPVDP